MRSRIMPDSRLLYNALKIALTCLTSVKWLQAAAGLAVRVSIGTAGYSSNATDVGTSCFNNKVDDSISPA